MKSVSVFQCTLWIPSSDPAEIEAAEARIAENLQSVHEVNRKLARDPLAEKVFRVGSRSCSARGESIGLRGCVQPNELVRSRYYSVI